MRTFIKTVPKGWGKEEWIANTPMYCGKLLTVEGGKRCSLHHHENKCETFHILEGRILLEVEGQTFEMGPNDTVDIYPYQLHRFTGLVPFSVILEVSTQHFEFDSIRTEFGDQLSE